MCLSDHWALGQWGFGAMGHCHQRAKGPWGYWTTGLSRYDWYLIDINKMKNKKPYMLGAGAKCCVVAFNEFSVFLLNKSKLEKYKWKICITNQTKSRIKQNILITFNCMLFIKHTFLVLWKWILFFWKFSVMQMIGIICQLVYPYMDLRNWWKPTAWLCPSSCWLCPSYGFQAISSISGISRISGI